MPRPKIPIDGYRSLLSDLSRNNVSIADMRGILDNIHGLKIGERALKSRLREWHITRNVRADTSDQFNHRVTQLFRLCLSQTDMLRVLHEEGFSTTAASLRRTLRKLDFTRRLTEEELQERRQLLHKVIREALDKGLRDCGRGFIWAYIKALGYPISRDECFEIVKEVDPEGVAARRCDTPRYKLEKGNYITHGPNFLWSIDGYCKLDIFGCELYAAIDAESRYIIWIHIGASAHTSVSCAKQYLETIQKRGIIPRFFRADRGGDNKLIAAVHWELRKAQEPGIRLKDCFLYGKSTTNQRIESWWNQLNGRLIRTWRVYFHRLRDENSYSQDMIADRIALRAIYMPILRREISTFVDNWNHHKIRAQKARTQHISGQPWLLYHYPKGIVDKALRPDQDRVNLLMQDVAQYDLTEFLPQTTLDWCVTTMASDRVDITSLEFTVGEGKSYAEEPHYRSYLQLRWYVHQHMEVGNLPMLSETPHPDGALRYIARLNDEDMAEVDEIDD